MISASTIIRKSRKHKNDRFTLVPRTLDTARPRAIKGRWLDEPIFS